MGRPSRWHPGGVSAAALCEAANRVASASGREIRLWDAATGEQLQRFKSGSRDDVRALAFASSGELLAVGSDSADEGLSLRIFARQGRSYKLKATLSAHHRTAALAADGDRLASGGGEDDGGLMVWELLREARTFERTGDGEVVAVALQGSRLAASRQAESDQLEMWDLESGELLWKRPDLAPADLSFLPDGLLQAGNQTLHPLTGEPQPSAARAGVRVERGIALRVLEGDRLLWSSGEVGGVQTLEASERTVWGATVSGLVVAWDLATGQERWRNSVVGLAALVRLEGALGVWGEDRLRARVLAEDDGRVLLEGPGNLVGSGPCLGLFRADPPAFTGVLSPERVWSGPSAAPHDSQSCWFGLTRRDLRSANVLEELAWEKGTCYSLRASQGWRWGTNGYWTAVWNPQGQSSWFETAAARPEMIALHAASCRLAASRGYELSLWDVENARLLDHVAFPYPQRADCLAFAPDGLRLLAGSMTGRVACYRVRQG